MWKNWSRLDWLEGNGGAEDVFPTERDLDLLRLKLMIGFCDDECCVVDSDWRFLVWQPEPVEQGMQEEPLRQKVRQC